MHLSEEKKSLTSKSEEEIEKVFHGVQKEYKLAAKGLFIEGNCSQSVSDRLKKMAGIS